MAATRIRSWLRHVVLNQCRRWLYFLLSIKDTTTHETHQSRVHCLSRPDRTSVQDL